jgi:hypothetical protein
LEEEEEEEEEIDLCYSLLHVSLPETSKITPQTVMLSAGGKHHNATENYARTYIRT